MASNYLDEESDIEYGNLEFYEVLGEGGFGTVKRVTFKQPYKGYREAAAKITRDMKKEEVDILRKVAHPNIVPLLGFYQDGMINLIILEYAPLGSLYEYLKTTMDPVPDMLLRKWAREALLALNYLHSKRILHRDIKPQNSLLFEEDTLKLCDFGLAREINHSQSTSSQKGTHGFMAPEIIKTNDRNHATYSIYSDVYAYGMLIQTICTRKPPFDGLEWAYVMFHVGKGELKPQIPDDCPDDLSELMERCWNENPKKRPDTESILEEYFPEATASPEADRFPEATASTEADRFPEATASTEADKFPEATASTEADRFPKATTSTEADRFPEATASTEADRFPEATASTEADRQEVLENPSSLQDASQLPAYELLPGGREVTSDYDENFLFRREDDRYDSCDANDHDHLWHEEPEENWYEP